MNWLNWGAPLLLVAPVLLSPVLAWIALGTILLWQRRGQLQDRNWLAVFTPQRWWDIKFQLDDEHPRDVKVFSCYKPYRRLIVYASRALLGLAVYAGLQAVLFGRLVSADVGSVFNDLSWCCGVAIIPANVIKSCIKDETVDAINQNRQWHIIAAPGRTVPGAFMFNQCIVQDRGVRWTLGDLTPLCTQRLQVPQPGDLKPWPVGLTTPDHIP